MTFSNRHAITLGIIAVMTVSPLAWGRNFFRHAKPVQHASAPQQQQPYTPVSQILKDTPNIQTNEVNGDIGVNAIQSLEYHSSHATSLTPVSMTAVKTRKVIRIVPTFAVFPVIEHHSKDKAFSDLPVMFSTAFANQLEQNIQSLGRGFNVLNPIYAYDTIKEKGLESLYNRVIADYRQAGRPNEKDLTELADQLSTKTRHVDWVVFAGAEFDSNHLTKPTLFEKPVQFFYGDDPKGPNYFVKGTVQIFSTRDGAPSLWNQTKESRVKANDFTNFTTSVYDDSDSQIRFRQASDEVANLLIAKIPETMYAAHSNITVKLIENTPPDADKEAFQRILKY